jgi:uncharacterized protein YegL
MTSTLNLILSEEPVTRNMLARMKVSKPNIAVVYADAFGRVGYLDGRPLRWSEQVITRYRTRYEVDLSDHRRTAQLDSSPLPSRGDTYFFRSTVDVGFRVADPRAVVQRNVTDALAVVYNHLIDAFRVVTRCHDIKDAEGAEREINQLFRQPVTLDEGIAIYLCHTRLLPDTTAQDYLRSLESAGRALDVGAAEHQVATATVHHEHELAGIAQGARLAAERREREATARLPFDLQGLMREHLAKHPDQTAYALELLSRHEQAQLAQRDINDQRSLDLVRYMIEQGMIQAADIELLRKQTLGRVQEIASPARPELEAGSWDDPLPPSAGPVINLTPESAETPGRSDPMPSARSASAVPVYVIVDESPSDQGYFEQLNDGMQTLLSDLAGHPDVISAIRLAVLGYAADVAVRMPLNTVTADSYVPRLTSRDGSHLAKVFEYLRERIPEDVDRLKSRDLTVGRPTVYLLCAAAPGDSPAWDGPHQRLVDRDAFSYAPNIVACGIGGTPADAISRVTAQPGSAGWAADPAVPLSEAARRYTAFVRKSIVTLGRAHVTGDDPYVDAPEGFRILSKPG